MDPDVINCMIWRIHVDLKKILAMPSSGKTRISARYGSKKNPLLHSSTAPGLEAWMPKMSGERKKNLVATFKFKFCWNFFPRSIQCQLSSLRRASEKTSFGGKNIFLETFKRMSLNLEEVLKRGPTTSMSGYTLEAKIIIIWRLITDLWPIIWLIPITYTTSV